MIKKAYEKPREVEYIEFKGRENFKEVCEFIGESHPLFERVDGKEYLVLNYFVNNLQDIRIKVGTIFLRWYDIKYSDTKWIFMNKKDFFEKYGDIN
ncbi:hypothetical protein ACUXJ9_001427 [Staphylococcus caledonicus]